MGICGVKAVVIVEVVAVEARKTRKNSRIKAFLAFVVTCYRLNAKRPLQILVFLKLCTTIPYIDDWVRVVRRIYSFYRRASEVAKKKKTHL